MSKLIFFSLTILVILSTLSSCRKVYDFIHDHPDAHDSLCRITQIKVRGFFGHADTANFSYNTKGDPVSILFTGPLGSSGNVDQYFRYDRYGRLSDYFWSYIKAQGVIVWHKIVYPRKDFIIDTIMNYTGLIDGPAPIAATSTSYSIVAGALDAHGRVVKTWSIPNDPHEPPVPGSEIIYDANGNLPQSDSNVVYDNMVNPYRTNKVWQFVYSDYSRNNRIQPGLFRPVPVYNDFGLPVSLPRIESSYYTLFFLSNTDPTMSITYACSAPKGPINY